MDGPEREVGLTRVPDSEAAVVSSRTQVVLLVGVEVNAPHGITRVLTEETTIQQNILLSLHIIVRDSANLQDKRIDIMGLKVLSSEN
jgi:hypothetical protein